MNIFVLDTDAVEAAKLHCDKHVVKMIVESAQMLSTAIRIIDGSPETRISARGRSLKHWRLLDSRESLLYLPTHVNHPCSVWTRESAANYWWHLDLFEALCDEYFFRYGKIHKTDHILRKVLRKGPKTKFMQTDLQSFPICMQDAHKKSDAVESYRTYYREEKSSFARWTNRPIPEWMLS